MKYETALKSIIGTREEQQDYAYCRVSDDNRVFAIVCDGIGGEGNGGFIAAKVTVDKLTELHEKKPPDESYPDFFLKAVDILDEHVVNLRNADGNPLKAGTTLVVAAVRDDNLYWLSAGDSRLYIRRGGEIIQVTREHNYFLQLARQLQDKEITVDEYRVESAKGGSLISFIGVGGVEILDINTTPFKLLPGDSVLLTSDGLFKVLSDEQILQVMSNDMLTAAEAVETLVNTATSLVRQRQDNTTCVLIKA